MSITNVDNRMEWNPDVVFVVDPLYIVNSSMP